MPFHPHTMRCCAVPPFCTRHHARSLGVQFCLSSTPCVAPVALHCCCSAILFRSKASWRTPAALSAGAELIRKQRGSVASGTTGGKMNEIARPVWQAAEALCALLCGATTVLLSQICAPLVYGDQWHCDERLWLVRCHARRTIHAIVNIQRANVAYCNHSCGLRGATCSTKHDNLAVLHAAGCGTQKAEDDTLRRLRAHGRSVLQCDSATVRRRGGRSGAT
jgi:hypothetical protein